MKLKFFISIVINNNVITFSIIVYNIFDTLNFFNFTLYNFFICNSYFNFFLLILLIIIYK